MNSEQLLDYLDTVIPGGRTGSWPEYQYQCPFCIDRLGDESFKRKLRINVQKGKAICYRCGFAAGAITGVFKALHGGKILSVEEDLLDRSTPTVPAQRLDQHLLKQFYAGPELYDEQKALPAPLPKEMVELSGAKGPGVNLAWNYLRKTRGLGGEAEEIVKRWGVGYCLTGDYANRLIIPVWQDRQQVYWTSRYCGDHPLKAKNPKNRMGWFSREMCLLGYDFCTGKKTVVIAEGFLSATPFESAVALMGKTISERQLQLLEQLAEKGTEEFVLATDPDASREVYETARIIAGRLPHVTCLSLPAGKDPFDVRTEIRARMGDRKPLDIRYAMGDLKPKIGRQFVDMRKKSPV